MEKQQVLKQYFGHSTFRYGQEPLIDQILAGRDVMGIMPTGGRKVPVLPGAGPDAPRTDTGHFAAHLADDRPGCGAAVCGCSGGLHPQWAVGRTDARSLPQYGIWTLPAGLCGAGTAGGTGISVPAAAAGTVPGGGG